VRHLTAVHGETVDIRTTFPCLWSYAYESEKLRTLLMDYYGVDDMDMAKKILLSCVYPSARMAPPDRLDVLPIADAIYCEAEIALRIFEQKSELYARIVEARPDASAISLVCGHLEADASRFMKDGMQSLGGSCVAMVFDGMYFDASGVDLAGGDFNHLCQQVLDKFGVACHVKDLDGKKYNHAAGAQPASRRRLGKKSRDSIMTPSLSLRLSTLLDA
jgi:hypothetical protein